MVENSRIYLDYNATTPLADPARQAILRSLDLFGNPSSIHWQGRGPKQILRESRAALARSLDCHPLELVFTSGGSESNNLVLSGLHRWKTMNSGSSMAQRNEWIFSEVEHPSVRRTAEWLAQQGEVVHFIEVNKQGQLNLKKLYGLLSERTLLISIMLANNETGTIFPIQEIAAAAKSVGALVHTDAVQTLGKIPLSLKSLGVDYASFSAHKFYALKGSGFCFCRKGAPVFPLILGGGQERHRRAGTENVIGIAALGAMAQVLSETAEKAARMEQLRDFLEKEVARRIKHVYFTAKESPRLPNTSHMIIPGVDGESMLMNLDILGFAVSTGAACSSGNPEPSPVLLAMGFYREEAQASLRISIGWGTTDAEIMHFLNALETVVARLRAISDDSTTTTRDFQEAVL